MEVITGKLSVNQLNATHFDDAVAASGIQSSRFCIQHYYSVIHMSQIRYQYILILAIL